MKIIADTNIYIASMRFAGLRRKLLWKLVEEGHTLVLTDFILDELRENFLELYEPSEIQATLENTLHFLATGQIEVKTYEGYALHLEEAEKLIREKDAPILAATMLPDVDYLVTRLALNSWWRQRRHTDAVVLWIKATWSCRNGCIYAGRCRRAGRAR
jgi:predicted nucleic acid-binding protein